MVLKRLFYLSLCIAASTSQALANTAIPFTPDVQKAAQRISKTDIRAHTRFLSADSMQGRGPSTQADKVTQDYLSSEMQAMGIKPGAANGAWLQPVPLVGITTQAPKTITLTHGKRKLTLRNHDDFIASSGLQTSNVSIKDAEIIFVGYGVVAPEFGWDDFKGVDVKGKILLVMNHNPPVFAGKKRLYYGRWTYKFEQAARMGAAGVIIIHTAPSAAYPWQVVQSSWTGEQFELKAEAQPRIKMKGWATEDAVRKLVSLSDYDLDILRAAAESKDFRPLPLGIPFSIDLKNKITHSESANVIGKIPGSDPVLASQAIIYSAHHDHLGMKQNEKTGKTLIYNGAVDNASGTAALLSIAKGFAALSKPVKRTVYFVFMAAEEQGLLGSEYFVKHSPIPVRDIAANINFDGVNFAGPARDVTQFGRGKSSIDKELDAIALMQGRYVQDDPKPENGSFYRADQFNFAKAGVPVLYMISGIDVIGKPKGWGLQQMLTYIKRDYHQPSDTFKSGFNFAGAAQDAQLAFYLGVDLANAKQMPAWNKGDEFEAARLHK